MGVWSLLAREGLWAGGGRPWGQGVCAQKPGMLPGAERERGVLKHTAMGLRRYLFWEKRNCLQITGPKKTQFTGTATCCPPRPSPFLSLTPVAHEH